VEPISATRTLDWTYQMPPAGDGVAGLEDYVVEDARRERLGKVGTVLRHPDGLFLAVEQGTPPLDNELVAVPWDEVRDVDHDTLTVRLGLSRAELEEAPRLDQARKMQEADADARRVTDVPGEPVRPAPVGAHGPVDRSSYAVTLSAGLLGVFAALVLAIFASGTDFDWEFALFAIPLALLAFAGVQAYRTFRSPYERR
jgi:hypothetical protein